MTFEDFFPERNKKAFKSYVMLEKISVLILLTLIDATANCDDFEFYLKNTSQYLYNNFLNFIDSILNRYGASNSSKTDPKFEKLKQLRMKAIVDIENKSMSMESMNKLLLKILRSAIHSKVYPRERIQQVEILLEKIEFGLSLNFYT
mmetsp:Transcript_26342/g.23242  ORF Transcript_26342/g.23242 Transcript_26342/m.23242 type:complete len:147 (+) Transcript_26342:568-1008(+)